MLSLLSSCTTAILSCTYTASPKTPSSIDVHHTFTMQFSSHSPWSLIFQFTPTNHWPHGVRVRLHHVGVPQRAADGCFHDCHLLPLLLATHARWEHHSFDCNCGTPPNSLQNNNNGTIVMLCTLAISPGNLLLHMSTLPMLQIVLRNLTVIEFMTYTTP